MSIQLKVWLIAGLAWLLAAIVIAVSVLGVTRANDALIDLNSGSLTALEENNENTLDLLLLHNDILTYAFWRLLNADEAKLQTAEDRLQADLETISRSFEGTVSQDKLEEYLAHVRTAFVLVKRNPRIGFMNITGTASLFDDLMDEQQTRLLLSKEKARLETASVVRQGDRSVLIVLVVALSIGSLIIILSAVFSRSIVASIHGLTRTMKALAADDLAVEIPDLVRRDELGQMARAVSVFKEGAIQRHRIERDLSDYREHLEELVEERTREIERQKGQIEEALNRERELNGLQRQFVAMVSHEFRTPLAIIDGNAQRLLRRPENATPDRLQRALGTIRISINRLIGLMESVLSAARLESGQIEICPASMSLPDLLREVGGSYAELHHDRRIILDIDALPDQIVADEKLIRQVISNIISNAIKYSPGQGAVWIGGSVDDEDRAVLSVRDEGVGIPLAEQAKLFERFFRASTSTGIAGSGIGLHLASHLVQMHGGTIDFESVEGRGTTFFVRLPIAGPAPGGSRPDTEADERPASEPSAPAVAEATASFTSSSTRSNGCATRVDLAESMGTGLAGRGAALARARHA
jgi:signal transduction histidine kinase